MKSVTRRRLGFVLLFAVLLLSVISAQGQAQPDSSAPAQPAEQKAQQESAKQPTNPDTAAGQDLVNASKTAVHAEEGEGKEHDENAKFKYSTMVAKLGQLLGIGPNGMYWVSVAANFIVLALFFWMLLRSKLPQMFRARTASIQKALKEAQTTSAEASRRLGDIERRLAKLDIEVNDIRAAAERDAAVEEERIRAAAEEDKHKVVQSAEAEITAMTRSARNELKNFAASLAVEIASHRIKVDDDTDHALVRQFVSHLGKGGE